MTLSKKTDVSFLLFGSFDEEKYLRPIDRPERKNLIIFIIVIKMRKVKQKIYFEEISTPQIISMFLSLFLPGCDKC